MAEKRIISYRNNHHRTVDSTIDIIRTMASANGYRTYVNDENKMENIIDFMFQHDINDSVFRIEIHLDEIEDWTDMYEKINDRLKCNNYDAGFDCYDINVDCLYPKQLYITTGRSNGKSWLTEKAKDYLNAQYGKSAFTRQYESESDNFVEYCKNDVEFTKRLLDITSPYKKPIKNPSIEKVIFSDPCTIILWSDDTKTIVRDQGEGYDPEKGMAMAICKKLLGNNEGKYYEEFKKWLPEEEEMTTITIPIIPNIKIDWEPVAKALDKWKKELFGEKGPETEVCCKTCAYSARRTYDYPCCDCYVYNKWEPQEEKKPEEQLCFNCKYLDLEAVSDPCVNCSHNVVAANPITANNWTAKDKNTYIGKVTNSEVTDDGLNVEVKVEKVDERKHCNNCKYKHSLTTEFPCNLCTSDTLSQWTAKEEN